MEQTRLDAPNTGVEGEVQEESDDETEDETQKELDSPDETQEQNSQQDDDVENTEDEQNDEDCEDGVMNNFDHLMEVEIEDDVNGPERKERSATPYDNEDVIEKQYNYNCIIPGCPEPIPINDYTSAKAQEVRDAKRAKDWDKYNGSLLELHHYHEKLERERALRALGESEHWPLFLTIDKFPERVAKFVPDVLPIITHLSTLHHTRVWNNYIQAIQDDPEIYATQNFRVTRPHAG